MVRIACFHSFRMSGENLRKQMHDFSNFGAQLAGCELRFPDGTYQCTPEQEAKVPPRLRQVLRAEFGVDEVFIGLNNAYYKRNDIDGLVPLEPEGRIAKAYENFTRTRLIECGPITEPRARLLFPKAEVVPQSAAIVPLEKDKYLGMLAFGAHNPERFQPRQGKLFLEMIAELVAAALRARLG